MSSLVDLELGLQALGVTERIKNLETRPIGYRDFGTGTSGVLTVNGQEPDQYGNVTIAGGGGGGGTWGSITGNLSDQTDLQSALDSKYSATNPNGYTSNTGTVTSVALTVPTGLTVSGSPVTVSGTLAVSLAPGYVIPTQSSLDDKLENITGLVSAGTNVTVTGSGTSASPYVISASGGGGGGVDWGDIGGTLSDQTDLQDALDNKYDASNPSGFTSNTGTVTSVTAGTGLDGGTITTTGTISLSSTSQASLALADTSLQPGDNVSDLINDAGYTSNIGTVTSVALSVPTGLSVSGSPVTTSGTLAISYAAGYQGYTSTEASKLAGIETGAQVNTVTASNTVTFTNKRIDKRLDATTSYSSALTPNYANFDVYHASDQDHDFILNAPSNLPEGNTITFRIRMISTKTFSPNSTYVFPEGNAAPATFEAGYLYEVVIARATEGVHLASWTRYEFS